MKLYKAEQYKDQRGIIFNATPDNPVIRNVMYITGREGAQRGNHVHSYDSHYCMVAWGVLIYEWQEEGSDELKSVEMHVGDVVLSEPGEKHRFIFEEDGAFIAMATQPRTEELYETDTKRVEF